MECVLTADSAASAQESRRLLQSLPEGETFVQDHPSLRQLIELAAPGRAIRWSSQGAPGEASQATVTLADALIAQTGSILVTAACGGRGAWVGRALSHRIRHCVTTRPRSSHSPEPSRSRKKTRQQLVRLRYQRLQPDG